MAPEIDTVLSIFADWYTRGWYRYHFARLSVEEKSLTPQISAGKIVAPIVPIPGTDKSICHGLRFYCKLLRIALYGSLIFPGCRSIWIIEVGRWIIWFAGNWVRIASRMAFDRAYLSLAWISGNLLWRNKISLRTFTPDFLDRPLKYADNRMLAESRALWTRFFMICSFLFRFSRNLVSAWESLCHGQNFQP